MNARVDASAKCKVRLTVNGELREFSVDPWRTLLEVLVEDFRLARTKEGCSIGECGACTVSMDSRLVASCLLLAVDAAAPEIDPESMGPDFFAVVVQQLAARLALGANAAVPEPKKRSVKKSSGSARGATRTNERQESQGN